MTGPLHMLQLPIDLNALARYADDRSWTKRRRHGRESDAGFDQGRALHHVLDETFGPGCLRPFRLMVQRGKSKGSVYAYTTSTDLELRDAATTAAAPEISRILALDRLATKPMPDSWVTGRRLGFDVRARAIVRIRTELPNPHGTPYKVGSELDAYVVEALRNHPDEYRKTVDGTPIPSGMEAAGRHREAVYRDWLAARFANAALLDHEKTTLARFQRVRVAREGRHSEGPDVVFRGELTIADPVAFAGLLAGGVGRHRAYGYGMLLLRHPRRPAMER
jgi:CRISPR system Cascade subunit CasE